jgi:hypothetical protein
VKDATVELFRPVGPAELALVRDSGWRSFPPRLPGQPIFYPVLTEEYARQIARDWNAAKPETGYRGYVTRFRVPASYVEHFEVHVVGGRQHREIWVPAERLDEFNGRIVGLIEVVCGFEGRPDGEPLEIP